MTLARMYAEVHRYLRGYPTARGFMKGGHALLNGFPKWSRDD